MKQRTPTTTGIIHLAAVGVVVAIVACTNSTDTSSSSGGSTSSASSSSSSGSSGSSGASDGGASSTSGGVDATKCAAERTLETCASCCGFTDAINDVFFKGFDKCACEGPCKTSCADTYCAATPSEPSQACGECLDADATGEQCDPAGQAECEKDAKCKAFAACDLAAKCGDKSAPDGG